MKRRNDEAEETASSSEENICSSRVIVVSSINSCNSLSTPGCSTDYSGGGKCGQLNKFVELYTVTGPGVNSGRGECGR